MTLKEYKQQKLKEFEELAWSDWNTDDRPEAVYVDEAKSFLDKAIEGAWEMREKCAEECLHLYNCPFLKPLPKLNNRR